MIQQTIMKDTGGLLVTKWPKPMWIRTSIRWSKILLTTTATTSWFVTVFMAFELLVQQSITASSVLPFQITQRGSRILANHFKSEKSEFRSHFSQFKSVVASNSGSQSCCLITGIKASLYEAVQGINGGIFGVPSAKKAEIEGIVKQLECQNPTPNPTDYLEKVNGCWKLVYSTISVLGAKRTKLGLRDLVSLGDFLQIIEVHNGKAYNVIKFSVRGMKNLTGELSIVASFQIASKSRVDIKYESSTIEPEQLMNIFRKNYDILLGIFNPKGWLEISYVDESMRIGRDDKGNLFILERCV